MMNSACKIIEINVFSISGNKLCDIEATYINIPFSSDSLKAHITCEYEYIDPFRVVKQVILHEDIKDIEKAGKGNCTILFDGTGHITKCVVRDERTGLITFDCYLINHDRPVNDLTLDILKLTKQEQRAVIFKLYSIVKRLDSSDNFEVLKLPFFEERDIDIPVIQTLYDYLKCSASHMVSDSEEFDKVPKVRMDELEDEYTYTIKSTDELILEVRQIGVRGEILMRYLNYIPFTGTILDLMEQLTEQTNYDKIIRIKSYDCHIEYAAKRDEYLVQYYESFEILSVIDMNTNTTIIEAFSEILNVDIEYIICVSINVC